LAGKSTDDVDTLQKKRRNIGQANQFCGNLAEKRIEGERKDGLRNGGVPRGGAGKTLKKGGAAKKRKEGRKTWSDFT